MTESIFFQVIVLGYLLVSLIAITLTYREQKRNGISSPLFRVIGFALCTIWPVALVVLGSARLLQRA
ncbi:hypothetical protein [Pseudogemmobacter humi]|uniref:Uncharacterized protein n=1 Tax=Pseudogemmobacter humi TaxID=2483812 RepID=A0A3P5XXW3_9RHOB|nr:hypothetical protein [Pseudogemmobacter humi]VDC33975.1 hypothetical protein XINFAN_04176 [Pseudogemmobacter humi]